MVSRMDRRLQRTRGGVGGIRPGSGIEGRRVGGLPGVHVGIGGSGCRGRRMRRGGRIGGLRRRRRGRGREGRPAEGRHGVPREGQLGRRWLPRIHGARSCCPKAKCAAARELSRERACLWGGHPRSASQAESGQGNLLDREGKGEGEGEGRGSGQQARVARRDGRKRRRGGRMEDGEEERAWGLGPGAWGAR